MFEFLGSLSTWQWVLIGGAAAGIVLLYFLKLRREPRVVSSTLIWFKTVEDLHVNRPFRWLRANVLLILQLLLLALLLLALLRPTIAHAHRRVSRFIIALDNSASMGATDVRPNRLEMAKRKAIEEVVDGVMDSDDMAMVIAFNDTATVVAAYTSDKSRLKRAIQSVALTHRPTDLAQALQLATALANPATVAVEGEPDQPPGATEPVPATLVLFSDGGFPDVPEASLGGLEIVYEPIGTSADNVGIVSLAASTREEAPDRLDLLIRVFNAADTERQVPLQLESDGTPVAADRLKVGVRSGAATGFELSAVQRARLTARLVIADSLPYDNVAYVWLSPPEKTRVAVITPGNRWLELAMSTSEVRRVADVDVLRPEQLNDPGVQAGIRSGRYTLVISDGVPLPTGVEANTILFAVPPPGQTDVRFLPLDRPVIVDVNNSHPLCSFVDLVPLRIRSGSVLETPPGSIPLARSTAGPIIAELKRGFYRDCVVGFRLLTESGELNTDWPIRISFPVFLMNVLRTYGRARLAGIEETLRPGELYQMPARLLPADSPPPRVLTPEGTRVAMKRVGDTYVFTATDHVGVYTVESGSQRIASFAVAMLNEKESDIRVRERAIVGPTEIQANRGTMAVRRQLWPWLVLLAIGVCLLEWYIYNRRVAL